jgi:hypothetical protein
MQRLRVNYSVDFDRNLLHEAMLKLWREFNLAHLGPLSIFTPNLKKLNVRCTYIFRNKGSY